MINFIKNVYIHPPDEYIQSAIRILPRFLSKKSILPNDFIRHISKTILDFILVFPVLNTGKKSVAAILYGSQSLQDICPGDALRHIPFTESLVKKPPDSEIRRLYHGTNSRFRHNCIFRIPTDTDTPSRRREQSCTSGTKPPNPCCSQAAFPTVPSYPHSTTSGRLCPGIHTSRV